MKKIKVSIPLILAFTSALSLAGEQNIKPRIKGLRVPGGMSIKTETANSSLQRLKIISSGPKSASPSSPAKSPSKRNWLKEKEVQKDRIWIDLDKSHQYGLHSDRHNSVTGAIDEYHEIPKGNIDLMPKRIEHLNAIRKTVDSHLSKSLHDPETKRKLELIQQTAKNKKDYLEGLTKVNHHNQEIVESVQVDTVKTATLHKDFMSDGVHEVTKNAGENLEHLDPAMRDGKILLPKYQAWIKKGGSPTDKQRFYYSLEEQDLGKKDLSSSRIAAENKKGSVPQKVLFQNGSAKSEPHFSKPRQLYDFDENAQHTDPVLLPTIRSNETKPMHYVIDPQGQLYVNPDAVNHSDILNGRTVLSAGMITFEKGKIKKIDNDSGHYKPSHENLKKAVDLLKQRNGSEIFQKDFEVTPKVVVEHQ